jgi:hypothetical protein
MKTNGITIMPEYIQSEGIEAILNRCEQAGILQIATSPYYMHEAEEGCGYREPPIDAGSGKVRLLDRPLWGKNEVWFTVTPSFKPNMALYEGLAYEPMPCETEPGTLLHDFIDAAAERGIEVYFQIMAAIPPALRVQDGNPLPADLPLLPDGSSLNKPLARNGSLASSELLKYTQALSCDLIEQYPKLAGIRFDWPEYPCYHLDATFTDFNPQVRPIVEAAGFDFDKIQQAVDKLWQRLKNLSNADLDVDNLFDLSDDLPTIRQWQRMKAYLATRYNQALCEPVHKKRKKAILHAFPPPFSGLTGFDFAQCQEFADGIGMKLYTMHLPMILNHYGKQLMDWNPHLNEERLTASLNRWLDLTDKPLKSLADYAYPQPEKPHQVDYTAQIRKIKAASVSSSKIHTMVHTYGPVSDFAERLALSLNHSPDGIWLNRYCYLDDAKHSILVETIKGVTN